MLIDFFASLSFFIIPYLTGRFFSKKIFQSFVIGIFLWFLIYFVVFFVLSVFKLNLFPQIIRILAIAISVSSLIHVAILALKNRPKIAWGNFGIGLFLLVFTTAIYFLVFKRNTPYPLQLNWDIYEHITLANLISQGKLSFFNTKLSDTFTFNSYSPIFAILLSLPKIVFQKSLLGIYWWLEYWHFLLTAVASFVIAKRVFKYKTLAILSSIISSLTFESIMVYSTLFLIPQTFVALIAILVLQEIMEYRFYQLIIASLVIILMHYVVGPVCILVLFAFYFIPRLKAPLKRLNLAIILATVLSVILISFNFFIKFDLLTIEEASHFNFSLGDKLGFFNQWYGLIFFVFLIIGYIKILKSGDLGQKIILLFSVLLLGLVFAPFSYFLKFYVLGHYLINLVIIAGLSVFILNLSLFLRLIAIVWITFVMAITFYKNQLIYKDPLHFKNYDAQISSEEINTGNWLSSHAKNSFLISDPSMQYILEATSQEDTQGGAYMNLETRKKLILIKASYDTKFIKSQLLSIKDQAVITPKKTLFVVGGRYFAWQNLSTEQKQSSFYNIWAPRLMTNSDKAYVDFLSHSPQFKQIYQNEQITVFEII